MAAAQHWEPRPGSERVVWAWFAVDGLHYLDDHDQEIQAHYPADVRHGHRGDIVDIAHVRWATGTALTALDLCAAALGAGYCGVAGTYELDLRDFDARLPAQATTRQDAWAAKANARRAHLPVDFVGWLDGVLADPGYELLQPARDRFTHSWLSRLLQRGVSEGPSPGVGGGHGSRTAFRISGSTPQGARALVETATTLATTHVERFLSVVMAQP